MSEPRACCRLDGKAALVTGASRGIGAACAKELAQAGARVLAADVVEDEGRNVASEIRGAGGEAEFVRLDVADERSWAAGVGACLERFGGLDVVVNNAGIEIVKPLVDTTLEDWRRVQAVNVEGVFLGTKWAVRTMMPGGAAGRGGSIVNMSSIAGLIGFPFLSAYCSSKGAVRLFTKSVAVECAKLGYGIRVNSVHPGFIGTTHMADRFFASVAGLFFEGDREKSIDYCKGLTPLGHVGDPADIAASVLYLASDASRFVTGTEITVDGGFTAA